MERNLEIVLNFLKNAGPRPGIVLSVKVDSNFFDLDEKFR
jgi:hypothetical protein